MANYPPAQSPYGAGYGAPPNPQPYLPTYPTQYQPQPDNGQASQAQTQASVASNYNAYGYNMAIPAFHVPPVPRAPPLPIYQGWNQDSVPLPPYTAPSSNVQYGGYVDNIQPNSQYYPPSLQGGFQQTMQTSKPFEHGEISEGNFEGGAVNTHTPPASYDTGRYHGNNGTGYTDNAQRAVFSRTQKYSPHQSSHANNYSNSTRPVSQARRRGSDSYSPYVSPREGTEDQPRTNDFEENHALSDHIAPSKASSHPYTGLSQGSVLPISTSTNGNQLLKHGATASQNQPAQITSNELNIAMQGKTIAEAKKKAQGAILNLWPYDVRYQHYIDEGFSEDLVGGLFDDLRMSRSLPQSAYVAAATEDAKKHQSTPAAILTNSQNMIPGLGNGLSANKLVMSVNNQGPLESSNTKTTAQPGAGAPLSDKERALQAKMDALRKSREERAQKAAAQKNAKSTPTAALDESKQKSPQTTKDSLPISNSPISNSPSSIQPQQQNKPETSSSSSSPPQPSTAMLQPPPTIPGLFLGSTASSPPLQKSNGAMFTSSTTTPRKRPVAADFDEPIPPQSVKRTFGHSNSNERLVIDVSDDEDEDVAMDLESEANQDSPVQSTRYISENRIPGLQGFFPPKAISPVSNVANTPPITPGSRAAMGKPEVLQQKESEIEMLKKKIAEAEARKKARQSSGTRTPRASDNSATEPSTLPAPVAPLASNVQASLAMQRLIGIADSQVNADKQRLAQVEAEKAAQAEAIQRDEAERTRLRRLEIEAGRSLAENEYLTHQKKLEEMRLEMAKIEENMMKSLEQKKRYNAEMARLGQETESHLQVHNAKLRDLTAGEAEQISVTSVSAPASNKDIGEPVKLNTPDHIPDPSISARSTPASHPINGQVSASELIADAPTYQAAVSLSTSDHKEIPQQSTGVAATTSMSEDNALEAALQEAVRAEADSHLPSDNDIEMETSFAPDPNELAPDSPVLEQQQAEAYSSTIQLPFNAEGADSDDYEPPEATPPESPPFSPAPPDKHNTQMTESRDDVTMDNAVGFISDPTSREDDMHQDGDEGFLQNGSAPKPPEVVNPIYEQSKTSYFTPYESPLRQFRAFRFHSDFKNQVAGGLRSLTYSNKIDPIAELCRYELAGGICNDNTCDLLHFKDLSLPDDVILTSLGSPEEFEGVRKEQFCNGLRTVLSDMRSRKIRDFDAIASEILAYRAKFLGDPSKVLPLEGVTI